MILFSLIAAFAAGTTQLTNTTLFHSTDACDNYPITNVGMCGVFQSLPTIQSAKRGHNYILLDVDDLLVAHVTSSTPLEDQTAITVDKAVFTISHCVDGANWQLLASQVPSLHYNGKKLSVFQSTTFCVPDEDDQEEGYINWVYNGASNAAELVVSSTLADAYQYGKSALWSTQLYSGEFTREKMGKKGAWYVREAELNAYVEETIAEFKLYRTNKLC